MSEDRPNNKEQELFVEAKDDKDLVIIWCPKCDKMISNEYKRCPQCGALVDGEWKAEFEVVKKLEKDLDGLIKAGYIDQALEIAKLIKEIGERIGDKFLFEEQEALIDKLSAQLGGIEDIEKIMDNCRKLSLIFNEYVKNGKILEAHELVEEFKRVHESKLKDLSNFSEIKELFSKDEEILGKLLDQQEEIKTELQELEKSIKKDVEEKNFTDAEEKWEVVHELVDKLFDEPMIRHWENLEYDYVQMKKVNEEEDTVKDKLARLELKINRDIDNNDFEAIDGIWPVVKRMLEKVNEDELIQKWEVIKKDYKELKNSIEKQLKILEELDEYENQIRSAMDDRDYDHADMIWLKAGKLVISSFDLELKNRWKEFKIKYQEKKQKTRFKKRRKEEKAEKKEESERESKNIAKKVKLEGGDEAAILKIYEEKTGKHAIWRGKMAKQYLEWKKENGFLD